LAGHDLALHREHVRSTGQFFDRDLVVRERQLEHDPARLDVRHPVLRRALTGPLTGFSRLLGQRTVREDVDPHLAATLDVPGDRDTGGLDLAVGHVAVLERLNPVLAEVDASASLSEALALRRVALAPLHLAWDEHVSALRLLFSLQLGLRRSISGGCRLVSALGPVRALPATATTTVGAALRTRCASLSLLLLLLLEAADELALVD